MHEPDESEHVLDTDTAALRERETLNVSRARINLEDWIFENTKPCDGFRILDLGCGTGKQIFYLAHRLSSETSFLGLDISKTAATEVNDRARAESLKNVRAECVSLDDCLAYLNGQRFHLILSTYAIYYASDIVAITRSLVNALYPEASIFLTGPGNGTNHELTELINWLVTEEDASIPAVGDFMSKAQLKMLEGSFGRVETLRLYNEVSFRTSDELMRWWRNHNSYRRSLDCQVKDAVERHVRRFGAFDLTKNVLGVRLHD